MIESLDLLESGVLTSGSNGEKSLRRDILRIFTEWSKEPLTATRIYQILKDGGHDYKMDTVYDNLETLIKKSILYKKQLPSKGKRERPSYEYKLRTEAIYELFQLTEDLVDAMGFAQLEAHNNQLFLSKVVVGNKNEMKSLRSASKSGHLDVVHKKATIDDLEKTWRLARHLLELQNYCSTDHPAYKDYNLLKHIEFMGRIEGRVPGCEDLRRDFKKNYGFDIKLV
jgi:predicted transcriptional regulator